MWLLRTFFPEAAAEIEQLQKEAEAAGVWSKWGCKPPSARQRAVERETRPLFMCVGCEARAEGV